MATLHLLCGLPATGKTTHARALEDRGAVRLTLDEWLLGLYGRADLTSGRTSGEHRAHFRDRLERVHARLEPLAERLLGLGVDVVLDFGLWERRDRDRLRALAARVPQARVRLVLFEAPLPELARRLEARDRALPADQFAITPGMLEAFAERFERPGPDEAPELPG